MVVDRTALPGFPAEHQGFEFSGTVDQISGVAVVGEPYEGFDFPLPWAQIQNQPPQVGQFHRVGRLAQLLDGVL